MFLGGHHLQTQELATPSSLLVCYPAKEWRKVQEASSGGVAAVSEAGGGCGQHQSKRGRVTGKPPSSASGVSSSRCRVTAIMSNGYVPDTSNEEWLFRVSGACPLDDAEGPLLGSRQRRREFGYAMG